MNSASQLVLSTERRPSARAKSTPNLLSHLSSPMLGFLKDIAVNIVLDI